MSYMRNHRQDHFRVDSRNWRNLLREWRQRVLAELRQVPSHLRQ
jgi:hypothetical protein